MSKLQVPKKREVKDQEKEMLREQVIKIAAQNERRGNIIQQLIFLAVAVSVVKANEPPGADAVELAFDEAFDIPFQPLGLPAVLLLY